MGTVYDDRPTIRNKKKYSWLRIGSTGCLNWAKDCLKLSRRNESFATDVKTDVRFGVGSVTSSRGIRGKSVDLKGVKKEERWKNRSVSIKMSPRPIHRRPAGGRVWARKARKRRRWSEQEGDGKVPLSHWKCESEIVSLLYFCILSSHISAGIQTDARGRYRQLLSGPPPSACVLPRSFRATEIVSPSLLILSVCAYSFCRCSHRLTLPFGSRVQLYSVNAKIEWHAHQTKLQNGGREFRASAHRTKDETFRSLVSRLPIGTLVPRSSKGRRACKKKNSS